MSTYKLCPHLAVTMGDPAGIGAEVILKALADPHIRKNGEITIVGNRDLLTESYTKLNLAAKIAPLANPENLSLKQI